MVRNPPIESITFVVSFLPAFFPCSHTQQTMLTDVFSDGIGGVKIQRDVRLLMGDDYRNQGGGRINPPTILVSTPSRKFSIFAHPPHKLV